MDLYNGYWKLKHLFSFNPFVKSVGYSQINIQISEMCFFICSNIGKEIYEIV